MTKNTTTLCIKTLFSQSRDLTKVNFRPFFWAQLLIIGIPVLIMIGIGVYLSMQGRTHQQVDLFFNHEARNLFDLFYDSWISLLFIYAFLQITDPKTSTENHQGNLTLSSFFSAFNWKAYAKVLVTTLIIIVGMIIGLVLFIIPGIFFIVRVQFAFHALLDKKLSIWQSIQYSRKITKWYFRKLLGFDFIVLFVNILGLLCVVIGLAWTAPMSGIASTNFYRFFSEKYETSKEEKTN